MFNAVPHANGSFDVKLTPQEQAADLGHGRMRLDKQFHGDLDGVSKGEMLAVRSMELGSGVYVAIERVEGTLAGRKGAFVLAHTGVMDRGAQSLRLFVAPDSGEGGLVGLTGEMKIIIEAGKHAYEFEYDLPDAD
jgi:hypothetical protein